MFDVGFRVDDVGLAGDADVEGSVSWGVEEDGVVCEGGMLAMARLKLGEGWVCLMYT